MRRRLGKGRGDRRAPDDRRVRQDVLPQRKFQDHPHLVTAAPIVYYRADVADRGQLRRQRAEVRGRVHSKRKAADDRAAEPYRELVRERARAFVGIARADDCDRTRIT
jgi:hypothetical protein